ICTGSVFRDIFDAIRILLWYPFIPFVPCTRPRCIDGRCHASHFRFSGPDDRGSTMVVHSLYPQLSLLHIPLYPTYYSCICTYHDSNLRSLFSSVPILFMKQ